MGKKSPSQSPLCVECRGYRVRVSLTVYSRFCAYRVVVFFFRNGFLSSWKQSDNINIDDNEKKTKHLKSMNPKRHTGRWAPFALKLGMPMTHWPYSRLPFTLNVKELSSCCTHLSTAKLRRSRSAGWEGRGRSQSRGSRVRSRAWQIWCLKKKKRSCVEDRDEQGGGDERCWSVLWCIYFKKERKRSRRRIRNKTKLTVLWVQKWKMYEIWNQFNQIWLYLSLIQDVILCVCLRRSFFFSSVIRTCSNDWSLFFSFSNKEQLPQAGARFVYSSAHKEYCFNRSVLIKMLIKEFFGFS